MKLTRPFPLEKSLHLFTLATILELSVMGIFLIRARSLTADAGYSLPRLGLLIAWLIGFAFCVLVLASAHQGSWLFRRIRDWLENLSGSEKQFVRVWGWLIILVVICWATVVTFLFMPEFPGFVWPALPILVEQYAAVIFIIGALAAQSLLLLWGLSSQTLADLRGFGTTSTKATLLFLAAFFVYSYTAIHLDLAIRSKTSYFPELAQSFLQGRLDLPGPLATKDLTLFDGKYYVSFPPLAALLLLPLVAMRGVDSVNILLFNVFFASLGIAFTFLMLENMRPSGWNRLRWWENSLLALFLGFGTAQFYLTEKVLVNLINHGLTTTFLALSLWLAFAGAHLQKRLVVFGAGAALGLAMLARPNVIFASVVLAAILFQGLRRLDRFTLNRFFEQTVLLLIPVGVIILGLFWYNQARFGSPFDFGYSYMLLDSPDDLLTYGQFHFHFIPENLFDNFLRLPYWEDRCQMLAPNPQGTSIFLTSPLLIYLVRSWKGDEWVRGAWISVGAIALTHALYYNSGAVQFGYRFSMDFMPVVVALLAYGFKERLPKLAVLLILYSVLVNYAGVLWSTHRWCENF